MLSGRWAVPMPDPAAGGGLPLGGLSPSAPLVFDVLPGDVRIEGLSADLTRSGRLPRWVRLAPYDLDRPALDALAATVADGIAPAGGDRRLVVESDDLGQTERFLSRLAAAEPAGSAPSVLVLNYGRRGTVNGRPTPNGRPAGPQVPGPEAVERLTGGRPALRDSVLDAGRRLRSGELAGLVERSRGLDDLTTRLAARLLQDVPARTTALLGLAALLGYCHRRFGSLEPVLEACGDLPWWVELDGGWRRFEPAWRDAVVAVCGGDRRTQVPLLGRLVGELVEDGAADAAIELCLDAGHPGTASDLLAGLGPDLVSLGRPLSVRRWLRRLPRAARRPHRALAGQARAARRATRRPPQPPPHRPPSPAASLPRPPSRADGPPGVPSPAASRPGSPGPPSPAASPHRPSRANGSPGPPNPAVSRPGWLGPSSPAASRPGSPGPPSLANGSPGVPSPTASRPGWPGPPNPAPSPGDVPAALRARLLGPVDVWLDGQPVQRWHGRKGTLLLAYLLLHRGRPVHRDALAATFWPDAAPGTSRNRLHVTLHALRADLQLASPVPVVVFDRGYFVNPDLDVRLDAEEFERAAARGDLAKEHGEVDAALAGYRDAIREYRGDLLSDHPYDDWTLLPREHYRVRMLDVLDRSAQLAFDTSRYPEAVEAGRRLLALDFCREDVHRLLMRAYARLGQPHLALRQFDTCSRQLRQELDMAPARQTVDLYGRIRARSAV